MKMLFSLLFLLLMAVSPLVLDADVPTIESKPFTAPDRDKASYALGMNMGILHKKSDGPQRTDLPSFIRAIIDVLDGKPTEIQEAEIKPLLERISSEGLSAQPDKDKLKISYAIGMRMGLQIKARYGDADGKWVERGFNDVIDGKPTIVQPTEIAPLLEQAMQWGRLKQSEKNKIEGAAFLEKNAKGSGIKILADGLQYRVIKEGTGELPNTNQMVYLKLRGNFVDGRQFLKHNHYLIRCGGGCQGWQEALPRMNIGSRWQIFVPPSLGFGEQGEPAWGVGPDATMIWDLEMVSIAPPDAEFGRGRLGHAFEDSDIPDGPTDKSAPVTTQTRK
ncbi:MAG TPA: FKBP-type peptidyl-prolyl cis-trans isomerase N-terminal domain-containing protein [Candidatus Dormibacteraeota bacterium]|nr:FKBP-type peptidyl-prolyl cis-trans isomerase N-terminal domain-containing protein [Candidatus Dormibacteraeota bacterium]